MQDYRNSIANALELSHRFQLFYSVLYIRCRTHEKPRVGGQTITHVKYNPGNTTEQMIAKYNEGICRISSNLWYKMHHIPHFKWFSSRLTVVFAQSIEVRCWVDHEDVVRAAPTGDTPTTYEW